jgi:thiaminase|tara:strand:+ start:514 stop:735 length:222 start_codon:yes stop_codon:yes gene_type:complete
MTILEYFDFIETCASLEFTEGAQKYEDMLDSLDTEDFKELIYEFTSVTARLDVSFEMLSNPFQEEKPPLEIVH